MARHFVFTDDLLGESFLSLGFVGWALQAWELTEVQQVETRFLKLAGKRANNPSWRNVMSLERLSGVIVRVRAPCQLPAELQHHGLMWEVLGSEKLARFSARLCCAGNRQ